MSGGIVRAPRAYLSLSDQRFPLTEWQATLSRHASSDTFFGSAPVNATGLDLAYFASLSAVDAALMASNDGQSFVEIMSGQVDQAAIDLSDRGYRVTLTGRDRSAKLIDSTRTTKNPNKQPLDIIKDLVGRHGLTIQSGSQGGSGQAGKVHTQDEYTHLIDNDSDWNTICRLAEREGFFPPYAKGSTIYLDGPDDKGDGTFPVFIQPPTPGSPAQSNATRIRLINNCHLGRDVIQTVRSSHTRKAKSISKTKTMKVGEATRGAQVAATALKWERHEPGLTDDQVEKLSRKLLEEKTRHELAIEIDMPGDTALTPRLMLQVSGTGSAFDQSYFIDSVTHQCDEQNGYTMSARAKNKRDGRSESDGGDDVSDEEGDGSGSGASSP